MSKVKQQESGTRSSKPVSQGFNKKRILVVDDHSMIREGLSLSINQEPDLHVCCTANDGESAIDAVAGCKPDLVMTDISLPGKSGLDLVKDVKAMYPDLPVVVYSMHDESLFAERVLRAGAAGYITKDLSRPKLLQAIRTVLKGEIYISEKTSALMVKTFLGHKKTGDGTAVSRLSDREFDIFRLTGQGLSTEQIANRLHVSTKTVETHRSHIKEKLQIAKAQELTAFAARWAEAESLGSSGNS